MRSQRLRAAFFRSRRRRSPRLRNHGASPRKARVPRSPGKRSRPRSPAGEGLRPVPPGANGNFFRHPGFNQPTGGRHPANGVPRPDPTARRSRTAEGAGGAVARKRPQSPSEQGHGAGRETLLWRRRTGVARRRRTCPESAQAARRRSHRCAAHPSENRGATSLANSVMLFAVVSKSMSPECSMAMRWPNPPIFSYSASIWRTTLSGVP